MSVPEDLDSLAASFRRSLRAANRSERTVATYRAGLPPIPWPACTRRRSPSSPCRCSKTTSRALFATCGTREFEDLRDTAIIRLLVDTGMRRAELLGMRVVDVDLDQRVAFVVGKAGRERACPDGRKTALALDRYPSNHYDARGHDPITRASMEPGAVHSTASPQTRNWKPHIGTNRIDPQA